MDAQTVFYTLGSIFIALAIVLILVWTTFVIFIFIQVRRAKKKLARFVEQKKSLAMIPLVISGINWLRQLRKK